MRESKKEPKMESTDVPAARFMRKDTLERVKPEVESDSAAVADLGRDCSGPQDRPGSPGALRKNACLWAIPKRAEEQRGPEVRSCSLGRRKQVMHDCACVAVVWGSRGHLFINALVLGSSLKRTTKHSRVLLHTSDVPHDWLQVLKTVWELQEVANFEAKGLYQNKGSCAGHALKFHAIGLHRYRKVLLMSTDAIVHRSVDHLFNREAPAALRRPGPSPDNQPMDGSDFWNNKGELSKVIDAGVLLLEPSDFDFQSILKEIRSKQVDSMTSTPEQNYLTRFYIDRWHSLGSQYNYEHTVRTKDSVVLKHEEIYISHFLPGCGPKEVVLAHECRDWKPVTCAKSTVELYRLRFLQDCRAVNVGGQTQAFQSTVNDWLCHWSELINGIPELSGLVDKCRRPASKHLCGVLRGAT